MHHHQSSQQDPLLNAPDQQRACFNALSHVCAAGKYDAASVVGAAMNLLANALRQSHVTRHGAIKRVDQLHAELREMVANNYGLGGNRLQAVYPFDQKIVQEEPFDARALAKFPKAAMGIGFDPKQKK